MLSQRKMRITRENFGGKQLLCCWKIACTLIGPNSLLLSGDQMSQKERLFPVYSLSRVLQRSTHCHRLKGKEAVLSPNYETFRNHYFWQHCTALCQKGQDGASKDEAKSKQGHLLMTGWVLSARILCQKYCQTGTVAVAHFLFIQMKTTKW